MSVRDYIYQNVQKRINGQLGKALPPQNFKEKGRQKTNPQELRLRKSGAEALYIYVYISENLHIATEYNRGR